MEKKSLQAEGFTFESAVLNVIVRWSVVHEVFNTSLTLITIQDLLGRFTLLDLLSIRIDMSIQEVRR